MKLLGLKVGDHDVNFSFFDGNTVRYYKKEREHQKKHLGDTNSLYWVETLKRWNENPNDVDAICVTGDEELFRETFDPSIHFHEINSENWFPGLSCKVFRIDHHLAHALSIWPVTDKIPTKNFVFDGDGDFSRSYSIFENGNLIDTAKHEECRSFGHVLESIARMNGIQGHTLDLCGKAMGLKSYGIVNQDYLKLFEDHSLKDINLVSDVKIWDAITSFHSNHIDFLATIHKFGEIRFPEFFNKFSKSDEVISFTGGVAQNSVINGKLQKLFPNLIIPPHSGDEGLSLGCLEFLRNLYNLPKFTLTNFPFSQDNSSIEDPNKETISKVSELLSNGKIVGWFQGSGEIGPRALGNRSILMDASVKNGKKIINEKIKFREWYRPFGCSILEGNQKEFFDVEYKSPFMLHVEDIKKSDYDSITHIDNTVRFQTVDHNNNHFFDLLQNFYEKTGHPLILNTSLNINGLPLAHTETDALEIFKSTQMDALCIGNTVYIK